MNSLNRNTISELKIYGSRHSIYRWRSGMIGLEDDEGKNIFYSIDELINNYQTILGELGYTEKQVWEYFDYIYLIRRRDQEQSNSK